MKQARISALYIPLVDILINNLQRLIGNFTLTSISTFHKIKNLQEQPTNPNNNNQLRLNPYLLPMTSSTNTSNVVAPLDSLCSASTISSSSNTTATNNNACLKSYL